MIVFLVALRLGTCPGEYSERIIDVYDTGIGAKGSKGSKGSMEEEETIYQTKCCKPAASASPAGEAELERECFAGTSRLSPCDVANEEHQCCFKALWDQEATLIAICTSYSRDGCREPGGHEHEDYWCDSPSSSAAPTANTVTPHVAAAAAAALLLA